MTRGKGTAGLQTGTAAAGGETPDRTNGIKRDVVDVDLVESLTLFRLTQERPKDDEKEPVTPRSVGAA